MDARMIAKMRFGVSFAFEKYVMGNIVRLD